AEHGGWRRDAGAWQPAEDASPEEVNGLTEALRRVASRHRGAIVERKTWSVAFHVRSVDPDERDSALVAVETLIADWLTEHPRFAVLRGAEVFEVRPARMDKATAVAWLRGRGPSRVLALGDDLSDEGMYRSLAAGDESVLVGDAGGRSSAATWYLPT